MYICTRKIFRSLSTYILSYAYIYIYIYRCIYYRFCSHLHRYSSHLMIIHVQPLDGKPRNKTHPTSTLNLLRETARARATSLCRHRRKSISSSSFQEFRPAARRPNLRDMRQTRRDAVDPTNHDASKASFFLNSLREALIVVAGDKPSTPGLVQPKPVARNRVGHLRRFAATGAHGWPLRVSCRARSGGSRNKGSFFL